MTTQRSTKRLDRHRAWLPAGVTLLALAVLLAAPALAKGKSSSRDDDSAPKAKAAPSHSAEKAQPVKSAPAHVSARGPQTVLRESGSKPDSPPAHASYRSSGSDAHPATPHTGDGGGKSAAGGSWRTPPASYQPLAASKGGSDPWSRYLSSGRGSGDDSRGPAVKRPASGTSGGGTYYQPPKRESIQPLPGRVALPVSGGSYSKPDGPPGGKSGSGDHGVPSGGHVSTAPGSQKTSQPPSSYQRPGDQRTKPFALEGDRWPGGGKDSTPPRTRFQPADDWGPGGRTSFRSAHDDRWPGRTNPGWHDDGGWPGYHRYYYGSGPGVYAYSGWGSSWYDPWWSGSYWWPQPGYTAYAYSSNTYGYAPPAAGYYDNDAAPGYARGPEPDAELQRAMADVAEAWTTGDIARFQAHLTPGAAVALRHRWEQQEPWVLAPPVLLDIVRQALEAQRDSRFRFVQSQEMEPGLFWVVAEHSYRLDGQPGQYQATMEFMFRRYQSVWLVEAITANPANYWWLRGELLDDAARESRRLLDEMERARANDSR